MAGCQVAIQPESVSSRALFISSRLNARVARENSAAAAATGKLRALETVTTGKTSSPFSPSRRQERLSNPRFASTRSDLSRISGFLRVLPPSARRDATRHRRCSAMKQLVFVPHPRPFGVSVALSPLFLFRSDFVFFYISPFSQCRRALS